MRWFEAGLASLALALCGCAALNPDWIGADEAESAATETGTGDGDEAVKAAGSDGDGDPGDFFGDCPLHLDDECIGDEYCQTEGGPIWSVCTQACGDVSDCPDGPPGSVITCLDVNNNPPSCFIDCGKKDKCPQGMACHELKDGEDQVCVFDE